MIDINTIKPGDKVRNNVREPREWFVYRISLGRACVHDGKGAREYFEFHELDLVSPATQAQPGQDSDASRATALAGWANSTLELSMLSRGLRGLDVTLRHAHSKVWELWTNGAVIELELAAPPVPDGDKCVLHLVDGLWVVRVLGGLDNAFQQAADRLRGVVADSVDNIVTCAVQQPEPGDQSIARSPKYVILKSRETKDRESAGQASEAGAPTKAELVNLLTEAERFISGFEDDEAQEGIPDLLGRIRAAIGQREERVVETLVTRRDNTTPAPGKARVTLFYRDGSNYKCMWDVDVDDAVARNLGPPDSDGLYNIAQLGLELIAIPLVAQYGLDQDDHPYVTVVKIVYADGTTYYEPPEQKDEHG